MEVHTKNDIKSWDGNWIEGHLFVPAAQKYIQTPK